jgi:hypothetical protein
MAWAPPPPCHFRPPKDLVPFVPPLSAGYADSPVEFGLRGEVFPKRYSAEKNIYSRIDRPRLLPFGLFRTHSITRMRKSLAQAVDANPDLDLIPRRSPARENALRRM